MWNLEDTIAGDSRAFVILVCSSIYIVIQPMSFDSSETLPSAPDDIPRKPCQHPQDGRKKMKSSR